MIQTSSIEVYTIDAFLDYLKVAEKNEALTRIVNSSRWGIFANNEEAVLVDATNLIIWLLQNGFDSQVPPDDEIMQMEGKFVLLHFTDSDESN